MLSFSCSFYCNLLFILRHQPEIVAEGRQEIYDCWVEANKDPEHVDQEALLDSIYGALQLGFNQSREPIVHA